MCLNGREEKDALLKLFRFCHQKSQCCWTLMLTAPDFFLEHFRVSLKNSPWLLKKSKDFTHIHTHKCFAFEKTK